MLKFWAWRSIRWIFGGFYLLSGIHMASVLLGLLPKPDFDIQGPSKNFQQALLDTGFVIPLLALNYVVAGAALLFERSAPLGLVVIGPVILIIFLTNTLLDTAWIWGSAHAVLWLVLAWRYRAGFAPLWSFKDSSVPTTR